MSKKLIGIIASLALVLSMVGVNTVSAFTASEIAVLKAIMGSSLTAAQSAAFDALVTAPVAVSTSGYTFEKNLTLKSTGADVTALQQILVSGGYLHMPAGVAYGYFGGMTKTALQAYQKANGITPLTGSTGPWTRRVLNASAPVSTGSTGSTGSVVTGVTGTDLKVTLAPTSPAAGAVVAGQAIADLVEYTFTNTSAVPAVVTNVTLQRGGVSNDAALSGVYLYNGVTRLTDAASISSGKILFNAPSGLFTVPAGSSMTIAVRADVLAGTTYNVLAGTTYNGQIFIISLVDALASIPDMGTYPISGASQTISSATLSTVSVSSSSPSTTGIDPQTDYVMWQGTMSVGTNDVWMKSIALRQIGSVSVGDLNNLKFYVDGLQVGATLSSYDANGYLTFDLSAQPLKVITGSHIIKLLGDVIGGSTKNFSFSIRQASDINVVDSQLNVNVLPTATVSFPLTSGVQTVNPGSLTIVKATDSPAGNVTLASSGVTLAKFTLKAAGEPVKIEDLTVKFTGSKIGALRNGALFANGSQIGSNASIGSTTATKFNSVNLTVYPGSPVTLEVRADIAAASGAAIANGDSMVISLNTGASNANLLKSLGYISTPAATANTLTVAQGTMSLSKVTGYANQSIIAPQTAIKLGSYTITAGTTEDLLVNTVVVNFTGASASTTIADVTDVYFTFGDKVSANKATVVAGDNSYAVNYTLTAGQTQLINVYGTIASAAGISDVVSTKLQVSGQTSKSIQTVSVPSASTYTQGQLMSLTTGALTPSAYAVAASSSVVGPYYVNGVLTGGLVKAGSFKFVATGDTFTIDELTGHVALASVGNVSGVVYKVNGVSLNGAGTAFDGATGYATTSSLSSDIVVPANSSTGVVVDAYLQLALIGTPGGATSSSNVLFTLDGFEKMTSTGISEQVGGQNLKGSVQYAYASVPTITNVALEDDTLAAGTGVTIGRVRIAADSAGAIDWGMIKFTVTKPALTTVGTADISVWTLTDDSGNAIAGTMATSTADLASSTGVTSGHVTFTPTSLQTIDKGQSQIYRLKTTIGGTIAAGYSVTSYIANGTAGHIQSTTLSGASTNATFVWSDDSFTTGGHSATTPDWNNDTLIKNLPTASQRLSY